MKMVSVIVPIYNAERYLRKCVNSILASTYQNLEVILVDDGSPDHCPEICDQYAEQDARVRVIHKENGGASSSREAGIQNASGSYVMVVDSDDWIDPDMIEVCAEIAQRDGADCVMCGYVREYQKKSMDTHLFSGDFSYGKLQSEDKVHRRIVGLVGEELREPQKIDNLSAVWGKLYRTNVARKGRIVSERMVGTSEDTIFNLYALENCCISYVDRCFYHYRKTNPTAITAAYKPCQVEKWDVLYDLMQQYIRESGKEDMYQIPFLNRVACGLIGLGLNEMAENCRMYAKMNRIRAILNKPLYLKALGQLDVSCCDLKWKAFFLLCKGKYVFWVVLMLRAMNYLRSRMVA